jgi:hypothetical protein
MRALLLLSLNPYWDVLDALMKPADPDTMVKPPHIRPLMLTLDRRSAPAAAR